MGHVGKKPSRNEGELVVVPPDGGWGWVVVFGSFAIHVIADGISYSFGVIIKELLKEFKEGKGATSWIVSILIGLTLAAGPLASAVTNRFGCRKTTIIGGLIATLGAFLSFWGHSILYLTITMGVITGLGFSLAYCPAIIIVTVYFEKRRALATGIAVAGAGVGTLIFPPLTAYLIDQYTWRGTFFVYAGIILNCVVCGALFRPPPTQRVSKVRANGVNSGDAQYDTDAGVHAALLAAIAEEEEQQPQTADSAPETRNGSPRKLQASMSQSPEIIVSSADDIRLSSLARAALADRQISVPVSCGENDQVTSGSGQLYPMQNGNMLNAKNHLGNVPAHSWSVMPRDGAPDPRSPLRRRGISECHHSAFGHQPTAVLNRKDIFYPGSVKNLPEYKSNPQLYRSQTSLHRPPSVSQDGHDGRPDSRLSVESKRSGWRAVVQDMRSTMAQMVDFRILRDPLFVLFVISNFLTSIGMTTPLIFLPDMGESLGIENEDFLLSIYGISNTIGRLIIGWVSDQPWADRLFVYNVSLTVGGLATMMCFLCKSFGTLAFYAAFYGAALSSYISLTSVILVDLVGLDLLTNAFGLILLFEGIASLIGAPIAGAIADKTFSYDGSFYFAGFCILISGAMLFPLKCIQRRLERRQLEKERMESTKLTAQVS